MKVHKGDMVLVISGPDKGAKGKVIQAFPKADKVLVEGVNRVKKHVANSAPERRGAESGGIVTQEAPIHVSNVMVLDSDGNPTRIGYRFDENGKKVRISRRNGKDI
ncbi:50S ribosomal protein L24 [Corynebacterium ulcerans]|uniref:50S ribosomal protein L24 n=1 Tax=Corynebacterium ulcerans TaxID=65058 RepID=UPI0034A3FB68